MDQPNEGYCITCCNQFKGTRGFPIHRQRTAYVVRMHMHTILITVGVALMCSQRKIGKSIVYLCSQFFNFVQ